MFLVWRAFLTISPSWLYDLGKFIKQKQKSKSDEEGLPLLLCQSQKISASVCFLLWVCTGKSSLHAESSVQVDTSDVCFIQVQRSRSPSSGNSQIKCQMAINQCTQAAFLFNQQKIACKTLSRIVAELSWVCRWRLYVAGTDKALITAA